MKPVFEDGFVLLANGTPDGCAWLASTVSRALREYAQRTDAAMRFIRSAGAGRQGTAAEIRRMYYEAFTAADLADGMQDGLVFFEHLSSLQNQPFSARRRIIPCLRNVCGRATRRRRHGSLTICGKP